MEYIKSNDQHINDEPVCRKGKKILFKFPPEHSPDLFFSYFVLNTTIPFPCCYIVRFLQRAHLCQIFVFKNLFAVPSV